MSLAAFLKQIVGILAETKIPFMLTGSLAAAYYGTPRATQDVNVVIDPDNAQIDHLMNAMTKAGFYVSRDAAFEAFKVTGQFNVIDAESGWKADLIVRKHRPFSESEFGRRQTSTLLGVEVSVASLEDLIIAKLEWSELGDSEIQRRDIAMLLDAGEPLDQDYLDQWIQKLGLSEAWTRFRQQ